MLRLASRRLLDHALGHNGATRTALLYVPQHVRRRGGLPLVLAFHSGAGSPEAMAQGTGLHRIAEREGFIVAYPRGIKSRSGFTWAPSGRDRARAAGDVAFVRSLMADLQHIYAIDPRRIFAVGFSLGGSLVYQLACELGDRIAAVAVVGGTMTTAYFAPVARVPILHIHGSNDRRVPFKGGRGPATTGTKEWLAVRDCIDLWREFNTCTVTPTIERLGLHGVTGYRYHGKADVELWLVEGIGHSWPGARREPSREEDAPPPAVGFSASEKIWDFFAAHPRPRPTGVPRTGSER